MYMYVSVICHLIVLLSCLITDLKFDYSIKHTCICQIHYLEILMYYTELSKTILIIVVKIYIDIDVGLSLSITLFQR